MDTKIFTKNGKYLMLALDHRDGFKKIVNPKDPKSVTPKEIIKYKTEIIASLNDKLSGLLIDDEFGLEAYSSFTGESRKPFLLAIENSGYKEEGGGRVTIVEKTASELKQRGALGIKLLLYFNKDHETAEKQIATARRVLEESHESGLPLFLEIVTYDTHDEFKVVEALQEFLNNGIHADVFKLEYPGSADFCKKVSNLLPNTPWILLTKGVMYEEFCDQLKISSQNGCSGFLAGRSIWQELLNIKDKNEKQKFLSETLPSRFEEISKIVSL